MVNGSYSTREPIFHSFSRLIAIINSLLLLLSIYGIFCAHNYIVDLFGNFLVQDILLACGGSVVFLLRKDKLFFAVSLSLLIIKLGTIQPFIHFSAPSEIPSTLRVLVSNVHSENTRYHEVIENIRLQAPQIVAVIEVNGEWDTHLKSLSSTYPYSKTIVREDNFGMALYSKFPFTEIFAGSLMQGQPPIIKASIEKEGEIINLIVVHTLPPASEGAFALRNQEMLELAKIAKSSRGRSILVGDLNTTPWSEHFNKLLLEGGLVDPRKRFGILPTWTQKMPLFFIPIDHILTTDNFPVSKLTLLNTPGSDHRTLIADLP